MLCQQATYSQPELPTSLVKEAFEFTRQAPTKTVFSTSSYLIRLVVEGQESIRAGQDSYVIPAGSYVILNPNQELKYHVSQPSVGLWVAIAPEDVETFLEGETKRQPNKWESSRLFNQTYASMCEHVYRAKHDRLGRWLMACADQLKKPGPTNASPLPHTYRQTITYLVDTQYDVFQCMDRLNSAKRSTKLELYKRLCIARAYIHQNLDQNLDLDTLAQVACLSKYHFIRLFKDAYGETPRQYLIGQRLERARELLLKSNLTFHEICHEVGLKDSSSFGRLFKRSFGATPQVFRQQYAQAALG